MAVSAETYALMKAGQEALRRGDAGAAREQFRRASATAPSDVETWLGLAAACKALEDRTGAAAAVDRALALAPRSFRALIARADLHAEEGDARAASTFYTAALRHAPQAGQLPPQHRGDILRAQQMCERYKRAYEDFVFEKLAADGFGPESLNGRFGQSLDLMMGRKKVYLQQPSQYYFPGLPQIQFYDRARFGWLDAVEAATDDVVSELETILNAGNQFRPYVEEEANRPRRDNNSMTNNMDWSAFFLWKNGNVVPENAARCPRTLSALEGVPHCAVPGRTPSILFSQLRPRSRIPPHHGYVNTRLICHLPLIVPNGCGFRVGNEVRSWEKGKAWVFDDTIEHEAWNDSDETRVILLFEIWRPELTPEERTMVTSLMRAMQSYAGEEDTWQP